MNKYAPALLALVAVFLLWCAYSWSQRGRYQAQIENGIIVTDTQTGRCYLYQSGQNAWRELPALP